MNFFKILNFFGKLTILFSLIFIQLSFIGALPDPFNNFDLVFVILFFIVLLIDYKLGLWAALLSGLLLEIYSPLAFGAIFFSLVITIILINFLFNLFFTNRSLYSLLILSSLGVIIFNFLNLFYLNLAYWLKLTEIKIELSSHFLVSSSWQLFFTLLTLTIIYIPLRLFSKRFKSVFLVEGRR